jgi:hypothetical protein
MITCDEVKLRFNDFIDDFIIGDEKAELLQHIAQCSHCFGRVEFEKMLKEKISAYGNKDYSEIVDKLALLIE